MVIRGDMVVSAPAGMTNSLFPVLVDFGFFNFERRAEVGPCMRLFGARLLSLWQSKLEELVER